MKPGNSQPFRAVLFDFDDTLVDSREALRELGKHWYGTLPSDGRPASEDKFTAETVEAFSAQSSLLDYYVKMPEIWPGCFESVEAALEAHGLAAPNAVTVVERTRTMLRDLRTARVPVGVVTNGPTEMQWEKVRKTGVSDIVDAVVVSEEFGVSKPDPAIFNHALGLIGASSSETLFVGDNIEADIGGASSVGMRTAWMSHGRTWDIESYSPDHIIENVWDVRPLLGI